ncbi:succinyldiaminopimelate transaminase [Aestuariirhabdus litorea]|uniref:Succinyldiaminopimelate transaminase n=1 Tax=Aestuariirhabdus litorea TaxID=2528527 RepID=A0A3P3VWL9_9GAMM|nr:succinyldiaminopimelate transaminase [Aestuariirhabdus litorea]RRJ85113.1 succinyldiaminopimelate transaminase [Aestuariirhabdus litorea]RWW98338.1 succinyldiaminopimelate transaminase [Endozoicomonadaceae bacterium GTF-13]
MNPDLSTLHPYPFEKLAKLKAGVTPPADRPHIALSIGEPKHQAPPFVTDYLAANLTGLSHYPTTLGTPELRETIGHWLQQRFKLNRAPDAASEVIPVNGTREALFSFTQALVNRHLPAPRVLMPAPFYQIYEGASLLAGAECQYLPCLEENGFLPDYEAVSETQWQQCQLLFLCSPGNPTGAVTPLATLHKLIELADRYDFVIASDECYSEIYPDEAQPPVGLLEACARLGRDDYRRCVVFHSLSKRSNLPGLRSGFVAGDASLLKPYLLYRTYHGCAMPLQHQQASILAWRDEEHVLGNRRLYRQKFAEFKAILGDLCRVELPDAGFYLWLQTPAGYSDETFARELFARQNITVLPGSYLAREVSGANPGANRVRMALVASLEECREAALRIQSFLQSND